MARRFDGLLREDREHHMGAGRSVASCLPGETGAHGAAGATS